MRRFFVLILLCVSTWANAQSTEEAIRAFSRLSDHTHNGLNFADFINDLSKVNNAMKVFLEGPEVADHPAVRINLAKALNVYVEAGLVWQIGNVSGTGMVPPSKSAQMIIVKYPAAGRTISEGGAAYGGGISVSHALPYFWQDATSYISAAKSSFWKQR